MQKTISRKHCRQGDLRQIHPLGQHLGADQNISLTISESSQQTPMSVPSSRWVAIESEQAKPIELLGQPFHHPLRTCTKRFES